MRRLIIDLICVQNENEKTEITNIGYLRTQRSPANALTKVKNSAVLQLILENMCCCSV